MANTPIRMMTLKQLIQLKAKGLKNRQTAKVLGVSRRTVNKYVKRIEQRGLLYEELLKCDEPELEKLFESPKPASSDERLKVLEQWMPYLDRELKKVGVTRWNAWAEYRNQHPDGYGYTRFCTHYQQWKKRSDVSMHFEHKAGDKLYVDYTGSKLYITDRKTGEPRAVEVLVAVLGCSQYTYVEATLTQKKEDLITAIENALHYMGGVPGGIVTDNLKAAVSKASKYEPVLNETFQDFALHYGTTILPTRSRKPRDKGLVEGAVNIVYRRIFSVLRKSTFFSLADLNLAIGELLIAYNMIHFQGKEHSRKDLFCEVEKAALASLPVSRYELRKYAFLTVLKSSHIWLVEDKHYYSVPYRYLGEKLKVVYTFTQVEIYAKAERVALHRRSVQPYRYTTVKDHMPSSHNFVSDWNPEKFLSWADGIGTPTRSVIEKILASKSHPEQAYKSCVGILGFARKVGNERLNNACKRAIYYQSYSYQGVKSILDKGLDKQKVTEEKQYVLPLHDNIRGKDYYQ